MVFYVDLMKVIIYIGFLMGSILIIRSIAKNNEWDTSYKKAFFVVISWGIISTSLGLLAGSIFGVLVIPGEINIVLIFWYFLLQILIYGFILYIGALIIGKIYEGELRESFSMLLIFLIDQSIITILFLPFLPILNL